MSRASLAVLVLLLGSLPAVAQPRVEAGLSYFHARAKSSSVDGGRLELLASQGFGLHGELFWRDSISTRLSASFFQPVAIYFPAGGTPHDVDLGTLGIAPVLLTARYHFAHSRRVAAFAGAGGGYVNLGTLDDRFDDKVDAGFGRQFTPAAEVGVRLRAGEHLVVESSIAYVPFNATLRVRKNANPSVALPAQLTLNPILLGVGVSWRF